MKKTTIRISTFFICLIILSCSSKKETAASIGQKWCDLNGKVFKAENEDAKSKASAELKKFEKEMENKYKDDEAFMKEVENEAEKCEDASEGR